MLKTLIFCCQSGKISPNLVTVTALSLWIWDQSTPSSCGVTWYLLSQGSGYGSVGWVVASDTRDLWFKSSHWQIVKTINFGRVVASDTRDLWFKSSYWQILLPINFGRVVASDTRDLWFKSSHWQIVLTINCIIAV